MQGNNVAIKFTLLTPLHFFGTVLMLCNIGSKLGLLTQNFTLSFSTVQTEL
jgi:hypothetical protein